MHGFLSGTKLTLTKLCVMLTVFFAVSCGENSHDIEEELSPPDFANEQDAAVDVTANEESLEAAALRLNSYYVTSTTLNLRTGPSTREAIIKALPSATKVLVSRGPFNSAWYEVAAGTLKGYVHGGFLVKGKAKVITLLPTSLKVVALTFDAGSDRGHAVLILDTLKALGVKASFGVTGQWAEANPDLVKRMAAERHMIFNHTYSHPSFTGFSTRKPAMTYEQRSAELWKTHSIILNLTGVSSKPYFRPPYGDQDESVLQDLYSRGYDYSLMWSSDSVDWKGLSADQLVASAVRDAKPGANYLYHVGIGSNAGPALSKIISALRSHGYGFVRISDYVK